MPRAVAYDKLLKVLSSAVIVVLVFVAVVENDLWEGHSDSSAGIM